MAGLEVYITDQICQLLLKVLSLQSFTGGRVTSTSFPARHMKQGSEIKPARIIFQILLWRKSSTVQRCRKAVVFSIAKTDIPQKPGKGSSPRAVVSAFQSPGLLAVAHSNSKTSLWYHLMYPVILLDYVPLQKFPYSSIWTHKTATGFFKPKHGSLSQLTESHSGTGKGRDKWNNTFKNYHGQGYCPFMKIIYIRHSYLDFSSWLEALTGRLQGYLLTTRKKILSLVRIRFQRSCSLKSGKEMSRPFRSLLAAGCPYNRLMSQNCCKSAAMLQC